MAQVFEKKDVKGVTYVTASPTPLPTGWTCAACGRARAEPGAIRGAPKSTGYPPYQVGKVNHVSA